MQQLQQVLDLNWIESNFVKSKIRQPNASIKADMVFKALSTLKQQGVHASSTIDIFWIPGRLEVLGKHTDYAGGRSLIAAVDKGFCLVASPRSDSKIIIESITNRCSEYGDFQLSSSIEPVMGEWLNYPMTVAKRLSRNFKNVHKGANIVLISDLPPASGMSSSSALMIAIYLALASINHLDEDPIWQAHFANQPNEVLASYLGTIENGQTFGSLEGDIGVGTFGGSEDHTAIMCAQSGFISQYSYCPVQLQQTLPHPKGHVFAIMSCGIIAQKTGKAREAYNAASYKASLIAEQWRKVTGYMEPHLAAIAHTIQNHLPQKPIQDFITHSECYLKEIQFILDSSDILKASTLTQKMLQDRFQHFIIESELIIPAAAEALKRNDIESFENLANQSHSFGATLLGNQIEQTIILAKQAIQLGAKGSSAFGAGFGGAVWALIPQDQAIEFLEQWRNQYLKIYPHLKNQVSHFITQPGPAAFQFQP